MNPLRMGGILLVAWSLLANLAWGHAASEQRLMQLDKLITASPDNARLYLQRAEVHRDNQHWDLALRDYDSAGSSTTDAELLLEIRFRLGRMRLQAGQPELALRQLQAVLEKNPEYQLAHLNAARSLFALNRPEAAVAQMDSFLALLERPAPDYFLERATMARASNGGITAAIAGLEQGVDRLGPLVVLVQRLVESYQENGDWQLALDLVEQLSANMRRLPIWLSRKGDLHHGNGRQEQARAAYREALAAISSLPQGRQGSPAILSLRTDLCRKLGDCVQRLE